RIRSSLRPQHEVRCPHRPTWRSGCQGHPRRVRPPVPLVQGVRGGLRHDRATRVAMGGVGGRGTVRGGVGSNCQPGSILRNADGSLAQGGMSSRANMVTCKTSDPSCLLNIPCDADILAWNTIGLAAFGAGGLVGNTVTPASAQVDLAPT